MSIKVAIIGKPNTGKSTLFNRIIGFRKAIVLSETGITRDRIYADIKWQNKVFTLVDTGGVDYTQKKESIQKKILEQAKKAIYESEIILLLLDVMTGIQQEDTDIANIIRKQNKKVILVINKIDLKKSVYFKGDFFQLGLGEPFLISAEQGRNILELLDMIIDLMPEKKQEPETIDREDILIRIAIIGKPNVGKSSILNAILKEERVIVDEIPGTTRDAIEISFYFDRHNLLFVDTSGLKREKSVKDKIEYFGNLRAIEAIKKSDLVLLVLDSTQAISMQDKRLARRIFNEKKACIIILNKYDLISKNNVIDRDYLLQTTRHELIFLKDAPILTTIAVNHQKDFLPVIETIIETFSKYSKRISTPELNHFLRKIINQRVPKLIKGKRLHLYYITQARIKPPSFSIFVNEPRLLYNSYQRFLENQFTRNFNLGGIPIVFDYKKSE
ncbi:MAG: ribosome biogenesis GTPase Der [Candidatus Atribacteria bacterium]|nr:ribosome biogenesis GTPase Der [Candidatus Atribacteria bacterium]